MTKLIEKYKKEAIPKMMEKFGYKNPLAVPKIGKVIVNTGFGRLVAGKTSEERKKIEDEILTNLSLITAQKPILTKSKKAISGFKTRRGLLIGAKVTLRGKKMYDFLERLINIALPRSRDFAGIPTESIDKSGNLTIGIREHITFPEISPEKIKFIFGFEITVITNAQDKEKGTELFRVMGFPIKHDH